MNAIKLIITGVWILFWLYWLISASGVKSSASSRPKNLIGLRVAIFVLVLIVVRMAFFRVYLFGVGHRFHSSYALQIVGLVLFLLGLGLAVWARVHIGKNWGMPMTKKQDPELVTTGPYRVVRHPIYAGFLLAVLGGALAISIYWLALLVILIPYFIYSASVEERIMRDQFPETYPGYKKRTKMLIPFIL